MKNFEACQLKHQQVDKLKAFQEAENENLLWGQQVHDAMAARLNKGKELPITMKRYQPWIDVILKHAHGGVLKAEQSMALDRGMEPAPWFDKATWLRTKIDVDIVKGKVCMMFDWKTGKVLQDSVQLGISATVMFAHHPEIEKVFTGFVWLGDGAYTPEVWTRDMLPSLWNGLYPRIAAMEHAYLTGDYQPQPSGLCKRHCPVTSCDYYGRGSY